jgi:hypothetical protein
MTNDEKKKWSETKRFNSDEKNDKWKNAHRESFLDTEYPDELI